MAQDSAQGQMLFIQSRLSEKPEDTAFANTTNLLISPPQPAFSFGVLNRRKANAEGDVSSALRGKVALLT